MRAHEHALEFVSKVRTDACSDALYFADPGVGVQVGQGEKLVAGLCDAVFHSQPVEQCVLGLLLAAGEVD
jgi:hypothetical protein